MLVNPYSSGFENKEGRISVNQYIITLVDLRYNYLYISATHKLPYINIQHMQKNENASE